MMRMAFCFLAAFLLCCSARGERLSQDTAILSQCYLRMVLYQQVDAQAEKIAEAAKESDRPEIKKASESLFEKGMTTIRKDLEQQFGEQSRSKFEKFIEDFERAEQSRNSEFLSAVSTSLNIKPVPDNYGAFRKSALETALSGTMVEVSKWLGEVQTWAEVRVKSNDVPPLEIWLARNAETKAPPEQEVRKAKPVATGLAAAEASAGEFQPETEPADSPFDAFSNMRKEKREKALQEAQAGMQQVAAERQAAETEYAAKKMAAAQADAEAMKSHAEKLAAVEKDALEQRQNSFQNKLKGVVGTTIGAAVGAFTGGIGARAGQELVDAVFETEHKK